MPAFARVRHVVGRLLHGPVAASGEQASQDARAPARAPGIMRGYIYLCRFAAWVDDYLNAARRRNEAVALEETKASLRAKRRSLALMLGLLSPEQREEFHRYRHFHVIGGKTGTLYRIRVASFANIDIIGPGDRIMYRICAHPAGEVPIYDVMAAQMLHLQDAATEKVFLKYANVHPVVSQRRSEWAFWVP